MKTLDEILKQEPVYLHNWKTKIDVISDFDDIYMSDDEYKAETAPYANVKIWEEKKAKMNEAIELWKPINILFASYGEDNYSGDAFVLFEQDGNLYEVNGSHCSCHGLEGQFTKEETTIEALNHRLTKGTLGQDTYSDNEFALELKDFLGIAEHTGALAGN
ncbi:MAG: hypothetical protein V4538_16440 [Bacteroidota bacterium]